MKPSEIRTRIEEINALPHMVKLRQAQQQCAEDLARIEELRQAKAAIVNEYGTGPNGQGKLAQIRKSGKLSESEFVAFRNAIKAEPNEDSRMDMIDAKVAALGL